ncbi:acyl-CoA dehydrogenase family protein [Nocardioides marmorisolisilvae]|uniref:Acyl-CoA dehydrogenase n=1 Tax=Nocardioides marmorisolisilvae TaxID=1542737 RepID=A0A3N0DJ84_9ACTN|nr:acyl-CoA dehydrogenase family protein [Nocardioides marmorisolisilvae]RNL75476.1 acyl-CoA dehydrogenase [Nocardioides marmorisolisilvae]
MDFSPSPRAAELTALVSAFVRDEIEPRMAEYHHDVSAARESGTWAESPIMAELRTKARAQGLWNLFLPVGHDQPYAEQFGTHGGAGLSNTDYAPLAELMGRATFLAPYVFNCNAPDTGNMEVLLKYGTDEQKKQWLEPLLDGQIRSAFGMTEPGVASSDATNMAATAVVDGDEVVVNGRKWFSTGVGHPDCKIMIFMGLSDPDADRHHRHTMVLVPLDSPGVKIERMLSTMNVYDEPVGHGEVSFDNVRVPKDNILLGEGRAFEIAQGRLGPGRIHHCMRLIGQAEVALELAIKRGTSRTAFGKPLVKLGGNQERIADARIAIDQARLLVLNAAWKLDVGGPLNALSEVSQIKVIVPNVAQQVIDMSIQVHGGGGLAQDSMLSAMWTNARALRLADGPDEVHRGVVARLEIGKHL